MNDKPTTLTALLKLSDEHEDTDGFFDTLTDHELRNWFGLSDRDVELFRSIRSVNEEPLKLYCLPDEHADKLNEVITEAIHQGFDGWTLNEQMIIRAFLRDVEVGINHVRR